VDDYVFIRYFGDMLTRLYYTQFGIISYLSLNGSSRDQMWQ